jgi:tetratricopeptide (TPR) repeat protein
MASMTASDVRDRLDHRFRLLVGTRRGLERHQTLHHAVAWSYDLLSGAEQRLLTRCSVFTGGFDLESACAVSGPEGVDDYVILDLLDALVRKSLLVAGRSDGHARFSMLETVRQFAEEQLAVRGESDAVRTAHAQHFAGLESEIFALWDSPRQREAYAWFATELSNLRTAFRWAMELGDLDAAASIAILATLLGVLGENYEPVAWAEEVIPFARAVDHPRLAFLYVLACHCWQVGRADHARQYADEGHKFIVSDTRRVPLGLDSWLVGVYTNLGQPRRSVEIFRELPARDEDPYGMTRSGMALALMRAGARTEAMATARGLVDAAKTIANPFGLSFALLTYGIVWCDADPVRAREALRRGLVIAHDSGNRYNESHLTNVLGRLEERHGDALAALEYLERAIHTYHDSGNTNVIRMPLASLAACLDRIGLAEGAATIAGYASTPIVAAWIPELPVAVAHLRGILGDETYQLLEQTGTTMSTAEVVGYAYDQINAAKGALDREAPTSA